MLFEAAVEIEAAPMWAPESKGERQADWQSVDRALRTIAGRRATLDADEAHWLRKAEALQIWRPLGMVSALDFEVRRSAEPSPVDPVDAHVGAVANGNSHVGTVVPVDAHVGAPTKLDSAIVRTQAKEALVGLGWKPAIAQAAVSAASAALGAEATLERLIFEALRRCPQLTS